MGRREAPGAGGGVGGAGRKGGPTEPGSGGGNGGGLGANMQRGNAAEGGRPGTALLKTPGAILGKPRREGKRGKGGNQGDFPPFLREAGRESAARPAGREGGRPGDPPVGAGGPTRGGGPGGGERGGGKGGRPKRKGGKNFFWFSFFKKPFFNLFISFFKFLCSKNFPKIFYLLAFGNIQKSSLI